MKLAIVGAGFSGLAAAWHLLQIPAVQITIYDTLEIGQGTSGMAAGLLHPFAGVHAKKNWRGDEGMAAALHLLNVASVAQGQPVYRQTGLMRVALDSTTHDDYKATAEKHAEVEWLTNCQTLLPSLPAHEGIFISSACKVFGGVYLQGLWTACKKLGAQLQKQTVNPESLLKEYDCVIAATGGTTPFLSSVKGQLLHVSWPANVAPLPFPISSKYYIAMEQDERSCFVGGTYERGFTNLEPSQSAVEELWPKAVELFPPLAQGKILQVKTGLRSSTLDHKPFLEEIAPNLFVLAGMGSKGLLYSALYAKELTSRIAQRF